MREKQLKNRACIGGRRVSNGTQADSNQWRLERSTGDPMIRVALIAVGFLAVTITLILMQPGTPRMDSTTITQHGPQTTPQAVTRANTDFEAITAVTASIVTEPEPPATNATTQPEVSDTAAPVLSTPNIAPASGLESLIIEALRQGQSEDYIDALVNHVADKGQIEVPRALVTSDGRVDTATLLTVLSKSPDAVRAGAQIYTVQPGDSLASIAFRYYGTTSRAPDLFAANSEMMGAPSNIAVGQELVIPNL